MLKYELIYNCDAYTSIGMGHLFRGIDVVNSFCNYNSGIRAAIRGRYDSHLVPVIRKQLHINAEILNESNRSKSKISIIDTMFYPGSQKIDNERFLRERDLASCLVFLWDSKHYSIPKDVDVAFNHLPYALLSHEKKCKIYQGFDYLPVPDYFYINCKYDINNGYVTAVIGAANNPDRIISFMETFTNLLGHYELKVILSPSIKKMEKAKLIEKYNEVDFHQNVDDLSLFFRGARAIVTTYGNTTFQALASKIPVFTIAFQQFQYDYGQALEDYGISKNLGFVDEINSDKVKYIDDQNYLIAMHQKQTKLFNNPGIDNIVKILTAEIKKVK